jgi:hypothetical protein
MRKGQLPSTDRVANKEFAINQIGSAMKFLFEETKRLNKLADQAWEDGDTIAHAGYCMAANQMMIAAHDIRDAFKSKKRS